jgi:acyl carrier protein
MFIKETFGITAEDKEIVPENFDSVQKLARYAKLKTGTELPRVGERLPVP